MTGSDGTRGQLATPTSLPIGHRRVDRGKGRGSCTPEAPTAVLQTAPRTALTCANTYSEPSTDTQATRPPGAVPRLKPT
jgi:hypothetical protein